jgi:Protein of unknown function (DUF2844)
MYRRLSRAEKRVPVMNRISFHLVIGFVAAAMSCLSVGRAWATLGEPAASVESDRTAFSAVQRAATARTGYTVQEIDSPAVTIREYISPAGIVFGVAWNGLTQPDLEPLFGTYYTEYRQTKEKTPRHPGRRFMLLKGSRIVVETAGHMRDMRGRAYIPSLVPAGVSTDEIK